MGGGKRGAGQVGGAGAMFVRVFHHFADLGRGFFGRGEGEESGLWRNDLGPRGVLEDHGASEREVDEAAVADPAAAGDEVAAFGGADFAE